MDGEVGYESKRDPPCTVSAATNGTLSKEAVPVYRVDAQNLEVVVELPGLGRQAVEICEDLFPDVIDIRVPGMYRLRLLTADLNLPSGTCLKQPRARVNRTLEMVRLLFRPCEEAATEGSGGVANVSHPQFKSLHAPSMCGLPLKYATCAETNEKSCEDVKGMSACLQEADASRASNGGKHSVQSWEQDSTRHGTEGTAMSNHNA